ncbi:Hpt domain-containing protein [Cellulophaga baltica]|uniref:Hpt domain-containing protein n=1 Tax=Cellulophaga TaxID=104264 RepID=UPI001C06CF73|nr:MULTISPECIES: Hpt domain-containing protein [Cellulophaga]MBU2996690.1 Hpt domain-containing protein [Cellulophaga baltica]MDO6768084.1 Hpt domain-containing protein [Cellulophaga sp. 1_MG-2023]
MEQQPNLNYIKQLAGDDKAFEIKFISVIKEEIPLEKKEYENAIASNNLKETADIVHKLKHKLNILSLTEDYKLAVTYEEELLRGDKKLDTKFSTILEKIDAYTKNL